MSQLKIIKESWDVGQSLKILGVTKDELLQVVHRAVAARNDATLLHPRNAPGTLSYIFGVGALREVLLLKNEGWDIDQTENIEAVHNKETGIKIIFQNTDCASDVSRIPKAISDKGPAAKRVVDKNQLCWPWRGEEQALDRNTSVWFLCVAVNGDEVTAEISHPSSIENKQFEFSEESQRIFLISNGEWDQPVTDIDNSPIDDGNQDFEIEVSRK